ncbi:Hypothetical protein FNO222_1547 [Francisella orientalis]|uniref:Uncharacterized protein n=1 Tax=Francisella orientalis TaxID=299583 RepID=A0ABM5U7M2_9GAMM|nr:hypothetical protein M973_08465 [Francisella orientalis LADL 07-285A]AKN86081.1 hypothetical protein FNO12_1533 [Francisella orientalis FNO12]AKN87619.1 Hypothetical protein FNO24_1535 [Francisella orientalis FNO24]AKN89157.1 Hypothetical protein FNO190_1533 [Francisella orientalis]AKU05916.1 Hypothetical protein FNO01_1533 [Francisella orientalis]
MGKLLLKKLNDISLMVHPCDANRNVYGHEIKAILLLA